MTITTEKGRRLRGSAASADGLFESMTAIIKRYASDAEVRISALGPDLHASVDRGWGCGASVQVRFEIDWYVTEYGTPEKPDRVPVLCLKPCEISWSSTGHHVASALCAVQAYGSMVAAAADIDTFWQGAYLLADSAGEIA